MSRQMQKKKNPLIIKYKYYKIKKDTFLDITLSTQFDLFFASTW